MKRKERDQQYKKQTKHTEHKSPKIQFRDAREKRKNLRNENRILTNALNMVVGSSNRLQSDHKETKISLKSPDDQVIPIGIDVEPSIEPPSKRKRLPPNKVVQNESELMGNTEKLPRLLLEKEGFSSVLTLPSWDRVPLVMKDIANLLQLALIPKKKKFKSVAEDASTAFHLHRHEDIPKVVVIVISGIGMQHIDKTSKGELRCSGLNRWPMWLQESLPMSTPKFLYHLEVLPGFSSMETMCDLIYMTIPQRHKKEFLKKDTEDIVSKAYVKKESVVLETTASLTTRVHGDKFKRNLLLVDHKIVEFKNLLSMTPELRRCRFQPTKKVYAKVTSKSPMFAIDCEMATNINRSSELVEVSMVNENLEVVYYTMVKPTAQILNMNTMYHGITKKDLLGCQVVLKDVQDFICKYLPADAILVGHSLDSDLKALKLCHPYCIDSSVIYNLSGMTNRKDSLKLCTKVFLGRDIQKVSNDGHDPSEDAIASLELVLHKLKHDVNYGNVARGYDISTLMYSADEIDAFKKQISYEKNEMKAKGTQESVAQWDTLSQYDIHALNFYTVFEGLQADHMPCCLVSRKSLYRSIHTLTLTKMENIRQCRSRRETYEETFSAAKEKNKLTFSYISYDDKSDEKKMDDLPRIDTFIDSLHSQLEENSLIVVVFTGMESMNDNPTSGCVLIDVVGQDRNS